RRLSAHSGRVRDLSADASGPESDSRAASLLLDAEDLRRDTAALSVRARREGARGLAWGSVERSRLHDQAAVQLAATATEDLTRAVRALRASDADAASRPGLLLEASTLERAAAVKLETIARALEALEAGEALSAAARDLEDALAPGAGDGAGTPDPETTARVARLYLDMCLRAAERLAPLRQGDPRWEALLDGLREAAQLFQKAIQAASGKDGAGAARLVAEGRARVEEAAALAKKLRGESEGALAEARKALEGSEPAAAAGGENKMASRELEEAYAQLEKLLEIELAERDVARRLEELAGAEAPDPEEAAGIEETQREIGKRLGESFISTTELVDLVARLIRIDREGREIASAERSLAAAPGMPRGEGEGVRAASLAGIVERTRGVARDFQTSGFKLSAVLPHVLRAYWEAGDAVAAFVTGAEEASADPSAENLLAAARATDAFLERAGDLRREALEAIADQERGGGGRGAAQAGLERARQSLEESAQLLRGNDPRGALGAQSSSRRSIADARGALRSRIEAVLLPSGENGQLLSRVLDEEAARLGFGWEARTRGSAVPAGWGRLPRSLANMPFPARYRELVRVYLRALESEGRP
ncbi:MAG TPA: hypothetical protein VMT52_04770, partial [Planctomycetota bacterium]|nr:hypothetical protein [Planctomycetota bacterium]